MRGEERRRGEEGHDESDEMKNWGSNKRHADIMQHAKQRKDGSFEHDLNPIFVKLINGFPIML